LHSEPVVFLTSNASRLAVLGQRNGISLAFDLVQIDRNFLSVRNRVRQKRLVCQRERGPACCGGLREGQNARNAMTTPRDPIAGRVRRGSRKGGFRADGDANRKPRQNRLTGRISTPSGREAPGRSRPPQRQATGRRPHRRERGEPEENVPSVPIWRWRARDRDAPEFSGSLWGPQ